jgi:hypothetical protein
MSDENETPRKGSGDCLTPSATLLLLVVALVAMAVGWLL